MLQRLLAALHPHWFRFSWSSYAYAYEECRCGKRRARSLHREGYAPVAMWWVEGHDSPRASVPPTRAPARPLPRPLPTGVPGPGVRRAQ